MITSIGISSKLVFLLAYCSIPKFLIDSIDLHQLLAVLLFYGQIDRKSRFPSNFKKIKMTGFP